MQRLKQWRQPVVSVLRLQGKIQTGSKSPTVINYDNALPLIKKAFKQPRLAAVALRINSPGGSAVQSSLIHACIQRHAKDKNVPVFSFVEDVAASGGYYLACAGHKIFANQHSLIGSIGAISFHLAIYGGLNTLHMPVTVHRSGKRKAIGSVLEPETQESVQMKQYILHDIHRGFIDVVKENRGSRLQAGKDDELFEGDIWMATKAQSLGLIDGIGDLETIIKQQLGKDQLSFRDIRQRVFGFSNFGVQAAAAAAALQQVAHPGVAAAAGAAAASDFADELGTENLLLWRSNSF